MPEPTENNNSHDPAKTQNDVIAVTPLNSMPYIGPPTGFTSSPTEAETEVIETVGPAMVFLPSHSTREELEKLKDAAKFAVTLTGSAATGTVGPAIGMMRIAESADNYYFRVSLPGVSMDQNFICDIEGSGKVTIKGVTKTGEEIICKHGQVFKMLTRNMCPPGHFSITFELPGPVDRQQFEAHLDNGMLEGIVKKTA
jgi:HSP20 family molecular chaperone IbpA